MNKAVDRLYSSHKKSKDREWKNQPAHWFALADFTVLFLFGGLVTLVVL